MSIINGVQHRGGTRRAGAHQRREPTDRKCERHPTLNLLNYTLPITRSPGRLVRLIQTSQTSPIDNPPHSSGSQKSHTHIHTYANTYANTYTYTYTHLHTHTWIGCKGLVHVVVLYEFEVREDECVLLDSCRGLCVQLFHGSQPRIPLGLCRSTHGVL
jgi:hypothetical protein